MASTAETKRGSLYTLGYQGLTVDDLAQWLALNDDVRIWDVRFTPFSSNKQWCKPQLTRRFGGRYLAAGEWFGNRNHGINDATVCLTNPGRGIYILETVLSSGHSVALMCYERNADTCHRKEVAQLFTESYGTPALHLTLIPSKSRNKGQRQLW